MLGGTSRWGYLDEVWSIDYGSHDGYWATKKEVTELWAH